MAQYGDGTVTVTNGSATIVGDTTLWAANVVPTNYFTALGAAGEDVAYEIASVDNDTTIQLTAPFAGTTGGTRAYVIHRDFNAKGLPIFNRSDTAVHAILNRWSQGFTALLDGLTRFTPTPLGATQAVSQADADALAFYLWSAGDIQLDTLAAGSTVAGRNTSAGTLNIISGSAQTAAPGITIGNPVPVLAGEQFSIVWETSVLASVATAS